MIKAKYYPESSILEAKIGWRPCFVWRSIFSSCDLRDGLIWKVGNGTKIQIWKDRWLPNPTNFRINSPLLLLDPDATVSELLEKNTKWWNNQLLISIFSPEEVQMILSIPPSCTNIQDIPLSGEVRLMANLL
jgi:hypothetical protein